MNTLALNLTEENEEQQKGETEKEEEIYEKVATLETKVEVVEKKLDDYITRNPGMETKPGMQIYFNFGGCHFTWPQLKDEIETSKLEEHKNYLNKEIQREPTVRRHVLLNLLGFVLFFLKDKDGAFRAFEQVLKEDPGNLNALKNKAFLCSNQGMNNEVEALTSTVTHLVEDEEDSDVLLRKARALMEEAGAYNLFEQHKKLDKTLPQRRMREALNIIENRNMEDNKEEVMEWKFSLAYSLYRLDGRIVAEGSKNEAYFKESAKHFHEIICSNYDFVRIGDFKGKAWACLGQLLARQEGRSLAQAIGEGAPGLDASQCFASAMEISPGSLLVRKYHADYLRQAQRFQEALEHFNYCRTHFADDWWACHRMGKTYLDRWNRAQAAGRGSADRGDLQLAQERFAQSLWLFATHYCYIDLAEVYCELGDLRAAETCCAKSEQCNGGRKDPRLYQVWAKCLLALGEGDRAQLKLLRSQALAPSQTNVVA